jgi:hypothetical protein
VTVGVAGALGVGNGVAVGGTGRTVGASVGSGRAVRIGAAVGCATGSELGSSEASGDVDGSTVGEGLGVGLSRADALSPADGAPASTPSPKVGLCTTSTVAGASGMRVEPMATAAPTRTSETPAMA